MFPLPGPQFPTTSADLARALLTTLEKHFSLPSPGTTVAVEGGQFPSVDQILITLTNASLNPGPLPPRPQPVGPEESRLTAARFALEAHPLRYQNAALDLSLAAQRVTFAFQRDEMGNPLMVLTDAAEGTLALSISQRDLQVAALAAARQAAEPQRINIEDLKLTLSSHGDRSLDADALLKVRKGFSGSFHVKGHLDVDDQLTATVSRLIATGVDLIGKMAAGLVQTQLVGHEGKKIPLAAFSLGQVKLRDLKIAVTDALRITATFGHVPT